MNNINEVILQGKIVHKFVHKGIAILTVNTGTSTNKINFPKVTFFGSLRNDVAANYVVGDHVSIEGWIQSIRPSERIGNQNLINIYGKKIQKTPSLLESAFDSSLRGSYKPFKNEFKVCGKVLFIENPAKGLVKMTVAAFHGPRPSFVSLAYYTRNPEKVLEEIKEGDIIAAIGCVQTGKKKIKGEVKHFENYVVSEIKTVK